MAEFKIAKVSTAAPREWSFKDRRTGSDVPMETYKVMLEGEDDPVDINRKPGNAPAAGELLTGTIEDSDFGKKFKPERKPFTPGGAPKDTAEIKAEWAIGQANAYLSTEKDKSLSDVEPLAKDFFHMVERVKTSEPSIQEGQGFQKAKAAVEAMKTKHGSDLVNPDKVFDVTDEPVNLDDIPF